jgi:sec-independent protein translocase protein TatC
VPIATILIVWSGMTTAESLAKKRPYIIVGAFVFGMLLTPPDVISQTLLAIPMWILFELGLIFSRYYTKPKQETAEENSIGGAAVAAAATGSAAASTTESSRVEPDFSETPETSATDDALAEDYGDNDVDKEDANDSGHGEYEPLSEAEMDDELDQLEADEAEDGPDVEGDEPAGDQTRPRDDA